jgi:hypothetical protein
MRVALLLITFLTLTASAETPYHPALRGIRLGGIRFDAPAVSVAQGWLPGTVFRANLGPSAVTVGNALKLGRYADLSWGTSRFATAERYAPLAGRTTQEWASGFKLEFRF